VEDSQTTQQPADQPPVEDPAPTGDCSISQSFPDSVRQWCGLIDKYASTQGLDSNLVAALIVQESGGDPNAYSHSGAVGLMQVMPSDGLAAGFMCVNGPCFASRPSMAELYDPEFNLSYGMRMLAGLVQRRGSVRDALLAYGPAEVGYYYADKVLAIYEAHR
jgi:soluble lytic murein transglycosylase-like protein